MSKISILAKNLKSLDELSFDFCLSPGINVICGENGIGKSTLINAMSKLIDANALRKFFKNVSENATVEFSFNSMSSQWKKNTKNGTWTNIKNDGNIAFHGFIESSYILGNRFRYANISMMNKDEAYLDKNLKDIPSDLVKTIGIILKNDEKYFSKIQCYYPVLVKTRDGKKEETVAKRPLFVFEIEGKKLSTYEMSSGEFIVTSLVEYIHCELEKIKENKLKPINKYRSSEISIGIIDEIEVGLHPAALNRLISYLRGLCESHKLCLFLSTHSTSTLSSVKKENIFLLSRRNSSSDKKVNVINPCYPAYAIRSIKDICGYDKIIFVEDVLAKKLVEQQMNKLDLGVNNLFKIIPIGGWRKVIEIYKEFEMEKLGGMFCDYIAILDGDIEEEFLREFGDKAKNYRVEFLPIPSLEKFFFKKIILENDSGVFEKVEAALFNSSINHSLDEVVSNYKNQNENYKTNDKSGKRLMREIIKNAISNTIDRTSVERSLSDIAMNDINKNTDSSLTNKDILQEYLSNFYS